MSNIKTLFYQINTKNIDKRIILLSDIHYYSKKERVYLDKVLAELKKIEYDYLCISGDLLDRSRIFDEELLIEWLKELAKISKVIISIGNHELTNDRKEHIYDFNENLYKRINKLRNVRVLDNSDYVDGNMRFIGLTLPVDFYYKYNENNNFFMRFVNNKFPTNYKDKYNILLSHSPKSISDKKTYEATKLFNNIQLVLCGHMHAGVTPYFMRKLLKGRGLIGPFKELFPKNAYGHIKIHNTDMIISSGITTASNCNTFSFVDPLFMREITVIDLKKNSNLKCTPKSRQ